MEKVDLTKQFAYRLKDAMLARGLNSQRSASGVCIHKLVEITGYSSQICRRYLKGEALPEPTKLVELAAKLKVSPGWLLFGESHNETASLDDQILISKNLLHYIFNRTKDLYTHGLDSRDIPNFLMELVRDLSQINANEEQSKKIIDLALSSIKRFNP